MGLLDDAIREHLELKRRRGADPGEVAREQREALEPVPRRDSAALDAEIASGEEVVTADASDGAPAIDETDVEHLEIDPAQPQALSVDAGLAGNGETAELDMRSVLGEEPAAPGEQPGEVAGSAEQAAAGPLPEQDSLEWEVPGEGPADEQEETSETASAEDVLEETPDFLRDTPEQERLWFEQRPPRDFDFDK